MEKVYKTRKEKKETDIVDESGIVIGKEEIETKIPFSQEEYRELCNQLKKNEYIKDFGDYYAIEKMPELSVEEKEQVLIQELRIQRETECFSIINRGQIWYETLDSTQKQELRAWYQAWLGVTATKVVPQKPAWLNKGEKTNEQSSVSFI